MPTFVSKCGIDCGACPWGPYPRKGMTDEDFERYRQEAKRILGYMPIKTPCVTCGTPDAEIPQKSKLPNKKCLIRRCVDKARALKHMGHKGNYAKPRYKENWKIVLGTLNWIKF